MSRKKLLASVALIPLAGVAFAQEAPQDGNSAYIGQRDRSNMAYLSQVGSNDAFIYQYGRKNVFAPTQNGALSDAQRENNTLGTIQLGALNFIGNEFLQVGNNVAGIAQFGSWNQ